jgi:hypothetical protein
MYIAQLAHVPIGSGNARLHRIPLRFMFAAASCVSIFASTAVVLTWIQMHMNWTPPAPSHARLK